MVALAADRDNAEVVGRLLLRPVLAAVDIFAGAIVTQTAGTTFAKPGIVATTEVTIGRARKRADNSAGANGDINVEVEEGVFDYASGGGGDTIDAGDIGALCYIIDDQTVGLTNGTNTRSAAGPIVDVDGARIFVGIGARFRKSVQTN